MPLLQEKKPDVVDGSPRVPKHRSALRRYRAAIAVLTLLGLIGKTVLLDTQALEAVMRAMKHLFGF